MNECNSNKQLYKRLITRFLVIIVSIALIITLAPKLFKLIHPFIFALIIASILNPVVSKIHKLIGKMEPKASKTRKIITLILNLLILFAVCSIIFYLSYTILKEIIAFSLSIQENWGDILIKVDRIQEHFLWAEESLPPQVIDFIDSFKDNLLELIKNTSRKILSSSITVTASIITGAGNFFINFLTFFLAVYFLISDYHIIGHISVKYAHKHSVKTFKVIKDALKNAIGGFLRAQLIIASCAFVFMFICLKAYGIQHAFVLALILGFIDLLPLLGTIAMLLPWGLLEYIGGDPKKGIYLISISIIFMIIRKIIEPKIMGSQTELHPLFALMSTYVGLKLLGIWGAILGPVIVMVIIGIVKSGLFDNTIADIQQAYSNISKLF